MIRRTLQQVAELAGADLMGTKQLDLPISGVSIDTRTLSEGNLYIPIVGDRLNGHDYAAAAIDKGAAAVMWNKNEPNPPTGQVPVLLVEDTTIALQALARGYRAELKTTVIGITGSNGKTSTKDMLAACLALQFKTHKTEGNLNNHFGVPLTLLRMEEDTEMAVIEMGMSGLGEIKLLSEMAGPDIAIITNIGEAHLGDLGSTANIVRAKLEVTSGLKSNGTLIYYGDHVLLSGALEAMKLKVNTVTFGTEATNDYSPVCMEMNERGSTFALASNPALVYRLPLTGKHQVINALAVIAAAVEAGMERDTIREGLAGVTITGMRNEIREAGTITFINDTYKSNPASAIASLAALYVWPASRQKIAVLGDMHDLGEQALSLHHEVGSYADPEQLDYLFAYGPLSTHTADSARRRMPAERVLHFNDLDSMCRHIQAVLKPGAVILIKASRGMKLEEALVILEGQAASFAG